MKVIFPLLGSMHTFWKAIEETTGISYIDPSETSPKTLTLCVFRFNGCELWMGALRAELKGLDRNPPHPAVGGKNGSLKFDRQVPRKPPPSGRGKGA